MPCRCHIRSEMISEGEVIRVHTPDGNVIYLMNNNGNIIALLGGSDDIEDDVVQKYSEELESGLGEMIMFDGMKRRDEKWEEHLEGLAFF